MSANKAFTFEISLSVLDHLGRNLYRSFATVIGEAISNAWDADADNVYIHVDKAKGSFYIKDDGIGMTSDDFQDKFLKIGYSKRKAGVNVSTKGRRYIGRKGIGKLALLSCAKRITVISRKNGEDYVGGIIDNSGLDGAIKDDLKPSDYPLEVWNPSAFSDLTHDHHHGTIIQFEEVKDGIRSSLEHLRKIIALYFRFSLLDPSFRIFVNGAEVGIHDLADLAKNTEFVWKINDFKDPYIETMLGHLKSKSVMSLKMGTEFKGFIASVDKPRNLKIDATDERVSVDLFVNGRLREKDILKHIPTARITESYLYGQIHFDDLDDLNDRFTSSREGIVADDEKYKRFLDDLKEQIAIVFTQWDKLRIERRKEGDPEAITLPKKERKSRELFDMVAEDYVLPKSSEQKEKVDSWVDDLTADASFNLTSYAECFISENLVRRFIHEKNLPLTTGAQKELNEWKDREILRKMEGNLSISLRKNNDDLSYLDLSYLSTTAEGSNTPSGLNMDSKVFRPIRNAVMHTALLSDEAKRKLTTVYENIRERVRDLLR